MDWFKGTIAGSSPMVSIGRSLWFSGDKIFPTKNNPVDVKLTILSLVYIHCWYYGSLSIYHKNQSMSSIVDLPLKNQGLFLTSDHLSVHLQPQISQPHDHSKGPTRSIVGRKGMEIKNKDQNMTNKNSQNAHTLEYIGIMWPKQSPAPFCPGLLRPGSLRLAAADGPTAGLADATSAAMGLGQTGAKPCGELQGLVNAPLTLWE